MKVKKTTTLPATGIVIEVLTEATPVVLEPAFAELGIVTASPAICRVSTAALPIFA